MRSELEILQESKVIAVVGASNNAQRPGNIAPKFLIDHGYTVIPVNPNESEILGQLCYPELSRIPVKVDVVSIFRRSEDVPPIVDEAIAIGAAAIWMQEGVSHKEAGAKASVLNIDVIMDRCIHCAVQDHEAELK